MRCEEGHWQEGTITTAATRRGFSYGEESAGLHGSFPGDQGWEPTPAGSDGDYFTK